MALQSQQKVVFLPQGNITSHTNGDGMPEPRDCQVPPHFSPADAVAEFCVSLLLMSPIEKHAAVGLAAASTRISSCKAAAFLDGNSHLPRSCARCSRIYARQAVSQPRAIVIRVVFAADAQSQVGREPC